MELCDYCTERTICANCHTSDATVYCHVHNLCFCDPCYEKIHPSNVSFIRNHEIDRLQRGGKICSGKKCPKHDNHCIDSFCTKCCTFVCSKCFMDDNGEHKSHKYKGISDLIGEEQSNINIIINNCKHRVIELNRTINALEQAKAKANENTNVIFKEIEEIFNEAIRMLSARKEELKKTVYDINDEYTQKLEVQIKTLKETLINTKNKQFHGQKALIKPNIVDAEATFNHFNKVKNEMEQAVSNASVVIANARIITQNKYFFRRDDIIAYIKNFGIIDKSDNEIIPYSNIDVDVEKIEKESDAEYNRSIDSILSNLKENTENANIEKKEVISIQPQGHSQSQVYSQQPQIQPQIQPLPPQPQPINYIESPIVSSYQKDGRTVVRWTVDPKIEGLNYGVGLYVGQRQIMGIPNGSKEYVFYPELPSGTSVHVANGYNNVYSEYGCVVI